MQHLCFAAKLLANDYNRLHYLFISMMQLLFQRIPFSLKQLLNNNLTSNKKIVEYI